MKTFSIVDPQTSLGVTVTSGSYALLTLSQETTTGTFPVVLEPVTIPLDENGDGSASIWFNDEINPSGTYYQVQIVVPNYGVVYDQNVNITGPNYNLAQWVPGSEGLAEGISLPSFETNGTANTAQSILNLKAGTNVTLTADSSGGVTIASSGSGGSSGFNAVTSGTNTTAAMVVGTGATLTATGTGEVESTDLATSGASVNISASTPPAHAGQLLISQPGNTTAVWADPFVQGVYAPGANVSTAFGGSPINPVLIGGSDYAGTPLLHDIKVDTSGQVYIGNSSIAVTQSTSPWVTADEHITKTLNQDSSGNVGVNVENSVAVTGTFYQATQPVSGSGVFEVGPTSSANTLSNPFFTEISDGTNALLTSGHPGYVQGTVSAEIVGHSGVTLDAVLGATKPANVLQVGGNDGTNAYALPLASGGGKLLVTADAITIASAQTLATVTTVGTITNAVTVVGNVASGSPVSGNPVLIGGSDGTDARTIATNASGQQVIVGAGTAGSGSGGVVSIQGVSSGVAVPVSGTFYQTTQPVSVAATLTTTTIPATSGGCSTNVQQAVGASGSQSAQVKSSAGQLYGYAISNPNASVAYVFYYNVTSVGTIGSTTNLLFEVMIPAGATANVAFDNGIAFSTGILVACSTTATGSTAVSTGLTITSLYA